METYGHPEKVRKEAERIIDRHLWGLCNEIEDAMRLTAEGSIPRDSSLAVDWDAVANVYPDPSDWDADEVRSWLDDHGVGYNEFDPEQWLDESVWLDEHRALITEEASPAEILQWFRVSSDLARWLDEAGECVVEWGSGWVWGRQCCGQHVILDGTFQTIARNLLDARGETY